MLIAIPSMGRADRQRTLAALADANIVSSVFFPEAELDAYSRMERYGSVVAVPVKGIGATRQFIIEYARERKESKVLMLDDDLEFFVRRRDDPTKLLKASPPQLRAMVARAAKLLDAHAHIGVATREGANRAVQPTIYNVRLLRALGYRADLLAREGVRFDRTPVMEDFDVALQLLERGYASAQINDFLQDQPGSNVAGGCSTYRTVRVQAAGATTLKKLHPAFVTVVEKPVPKSKGWFDEPRLDVRVAWKKAFESAEEMRSV